MAKLLRHWTVRSPANRVVVLCYHSIHPTKSFASATPELFEHHLRWLKEHCELVRFTEVRQALKCNARKRPAVAITFDDGYRDNYEFAFPLIQRYAVPATFFVTVGLIENDPAVAERIQMFQRSSFEGIRPLDWFQISEMRRAGLEFGPHTYSHPNLARLDRPAAELELTRSKDIMEQRLGEPSLLMAYPFGKPRRHFTAETVEIVEEAGYEFAAAVLFRAIRPSDSLLELPRFIVSGDDIETLSEKVCGSWDLLGLWQEKSPLWAAKIVSPQDFIS